MQAFTHQQLARFNGEDEPQILIAFDGIVYDVTECQKWKHGFHEGQHFPGLDLTGEILDAPHTADVLKRPCAKPVGYLHKNP